MLLTAALETVAPLDLPPSVDSRVVYVSSSSGNDANTGLSADQPVKTIARGYSLIRDGMPDHLLLKAGDTWDTPLGQVIAPGLGAWNKSGRSASEPIVVSSYGSGDRPLIVLSGEAYGFTIASGVSRSHVVLSGVHFQNTSGGGAGIRFYTNGSDLVVDNCVVEGFYDNVLVQEPPSGSLSNVRIRRSQVLDAFSGSGTGRPQGMYASGVDGLVLEGNLFDHNGWKDGVSSPTVFSHNVYTADCTNLTVKGNIFSNASSFGLIVQSSATGNIVNPDIENNLFIGGANGLTIGGNANAGSYQYAVKKATIRGNVFTELGRNIGGADQSYGIDLGSTDGAVVADNLFVNKGNAGTSFAVAMRATTGYRNVTVSNNTAYNWNKGYVWLGKGPFDGVQVTGNTFQDTKYASAAGVVDATLPLAGVTYSANTYYTTAPASQWFLVQGGAKSLEQWLQLTGETGARAKQVTFTDVTRTAETYAASIGVTAATGADFVAHARQVGLGQDGYPATIVDYLKAGFAPAGAGTPPSTDLVAPTAVANVANVMATGNGTYLFTVTYTDNVAIDLATLGGGDVNLLGPDGIVLPVAYVGATTAGGKTTATYAVAVPGGAWAYRNNGTYAVNVLAGQVRDTSGNAVTAGKIGSFAVSVAPGENTQSTAYDMGQVSVGTKLVMSDAVTAAGSMYYKFLVAGDPVSVMSRITGFTSRMAMEILSSAGTVVRSNAVDASVGVLTLTPVMSAGTYFIRLTPQGGMPSSGVPYQLLVTGSTVATTATATTLRGITTTAAGSAGTAVIFAPSSTAMSAGNSGTPKVQGATPITTAVLSDSAESAKLSIV